MKRKKGRRDERAPDVPRPPPSSSSKPVKFSENACPETRQ